MTIRAAADGSALGNPGPAGWAWYIDDSSWGAGGWTHATNNQAELTAVLQFFRSTAHLDEDLLILCDSQYVINCITKWMPGWKSKGWRKADGKPVMNVELLKEIDEVILGRRYRFEWVKGHANHPLNEAADSRARAVSEAIARGSAVAAGPGFTSAVHESSSRPAATTLRAPAGPVKASSATTAMFDLDGFGPEDSLASDDGHSRDTLELVVRLTKAEFERLQSRARTRGVSPETVLRDLI